MEKPFRPFHEARHLGFAHRLGGSGASPQGPNNLQKIQPVLMSRRLQGV